MEPLQVLVVDLNVGFSQEGNMSSPRVGALIEPTADFLRGLPAGSRVVFVSDCHEPGDPELCRFPWHCGNGTGEELVRPELIAACEEAAIRYDIIYKIEHEAFIGSASNEVNAKRWTRFKGLISEFDKDDWVVIGCVTDICVESNVAALVMRGQSVTVVRNLIDTYDLPLEACRELGLPDSSAHNADEINELWFGHRFPAVWGARVVQDWRELVEETTA